MSVLETLKGFLSSGSAPTSATDPLSKPTSVPVIGRRPGTGAEYMRGGRSMTFANWRPSLRTAKKDVAVAWDQATARTVDLIQNGAWFTGMVDQAVANTVGTGLRLFANPDHEALGITASEASKLARIFERRFNTWANSKEECDVEGRRTFGQQQAAGFRGWFPTGEIWAEYPLRNHPGLEFKTKCRLIPATRITRNSSPMENLVSGVYLDRDDRAVGYQAYRENNYGFREEYRVAARGPQGRPRVTHVFDGYPGAVRGITPMVSALQVAKQLDLLADATITSWLVQTIFAASVTSDQPTDEMITGLLSPQEQAKMVSAGASPFDIWFQAQTGWYDGAPLDLGVNGRIAHLFPGQSFDFHSPENKAADFRSLNVMLLREISRCVGLTYESATGDYEGATYSSVRMATNEIFKITLYRRMNVVRPFCQPAYEAVIEEDIRRGRIIVPGGLRNFLAKRSAFLRADWRGSPQPQADDYKTAKKNETYWRMGVVTDEMIAQELGTDVETVYDGRAREKQMREDRELPEPADAPGGDQAVEAALVGEDKGSADK